VPSLKTRVLTECFGFHVVVRTASRQWTTWMAVRYSVESFRYSPWANEVQINRLLKASASQFAAGIVHFDQWSSRFAQKPQRSSWMSVLNLNSFSIHTIVKSLNPNNISQNVNSTQDSRGVKLVLQFFELLTRSWTCKMPHAIITKLQWTLLQTFGLLTVRLDNLICIEPSRWRYFKTELVCAVRGE